MVTLFEALEDAFNTPEELDAGFDHFATLLLDTARRPGPSRLSTSHLQSFFQLANTVLVRLDGLLIEREAEQRQEHERQVAEMRKDAAPKQIAVSFCAKEVLY